MLWLSYIDQSMVVFFVSPRGTVLSHKKEYGGKASALCEWWQNERQAGRGRDEDEDEERWQRLLQLMPLTDEEPT